LPTVIHPPTQQHGTGEKKGQRKTKVDLMIWGFLFGGVLGGILNHRWRLGIIMRLTENSGKNMVPALSTVQPEAVFAATGAIDAKGAALEPLIRNARMGESEDCLWPVASSARRSVSDQSDSRREEPVQPSLARARARFRMCCRRCVV
jgi:hypothetical protein